MTAVAHQWVSVNAYITHVEARFPTPDTDPPGPTIPAGWKTHASCHGMADTFFADGERQSIFTIRMVAEARAICATCPVRMRCLTHALTTPERAGIWAGTTGRQRDRILRSIKKGRFTLEKVLDDFRRGDTDRYERLTIVVDDEPDE